jgi:hypothetical protein
MVITEHFTVWLYFHEEQLSQTRYDKLSKSWQQIKIKTRKNEPLRDGCSGWYRDTTTSNFELLLISYLSVHRRSGKYETYPPITFTEASSGLPKSAWSDCYLTYAPNLHYMALILSHIQFTRPRPLVPQRLAPATRVALLDIGFLTWNKAIRDQLHIFYFVWNVMCPKYATKLTSHLN